MEIKQSNKASDAETGRSLGHRRLSMSRTLLTRSWVCPPMQVRARQEWSRHRVLGETCSLYMIRAAQDR